MPNSPSEIIRAVDPILSTIAQGYSNASFIAEKLLPVVKVENMKGRIPSWDKSAFIAKESIRAIRADSNRISSADISFIDYETRERDLEQAFDMLELEQAPDAIQYEKRIVKELQDLMSLDLERKAAEILLNPASYAVGNSETLSAADMFDNPDSNPIETIKDAMGVVRKKIAAYPNILAMSEKVYRALCEHPKIIERIKYSGAATVSSKALCELFGVEEIVVGLAISSADGLTFQDIWSNKLLALYVDRSPSDNRSEYNSSYGYTMRLKDKPEVDYYYESGGKIKALRVTDNYQLLVLSPQSGYLISNATA